MEDALGVWKLPTEEAQDGTAVDDGVSWRVQPCKITSCLSGQEACGGETERSRVAMNSALFKTVMLHSGKIILVSEHLYMIGTPLQDTFPYQGILI